MNESDHQTREELLFQAAAEMERGERAIFLRGACLGDDALRQRLETLLTVYDAPDPLAKGSSREQPTIKIGHEGTAVGQKIGRYKILEKLGEGGCGAVYVAEQTVPVQRRVALKVIKLGMDTKAVVARFEAERQALAIMDHPNIAKVLDAGETEAGRPYFVMELVRGIRITDYCDQNHVSTVDRLRLFVTVCHAIQHAHQKGIIHRDIKPSNILVTLHDGEPVPKVIDFGIAKATEGRLTDATVYTQLNQFIGTPAYMSPEQAEMSGLDIDTRSDIYSLGVLLYELLVGETPFNAVELAQSGLDEMRRTIREKEPVRPSTRCATMTAAELTTTAKRRGSDAPKLVNLLRGDLDWIVMKCLEKDRTRRYETTNGLAMDLMRHLRNEPVVARPPSQIYRFQKAARRNRVAFTAAAAVMVAMAIGIVVSSAEAIQARHAREKALVEKTRADHEAAMAKQVSGVLQQMLNSANPDTLKGTDYTVRQLLDDSSAALSDQLAGDPEVEASVRSTIGRAYQRLGSGEKALAQFNRALALRRQLFGEADDRVAESQIDCAWALFEQDDFIHAEVFARDGLRIYRAENAQGQPYIYGLWALERILFGEGHYSEVDTVTDEALVVAAKTPKVEYPEIASILHGEAEAQTARGNYAEGERLARQALALHQKLRPPGDLETAWAMDALGVALGNEHKYGEAAAVFRQALSQFRRQYGPSHKSIGYVLQFLRNTLVGAGDFAGLEKLDLEMLDWQQSAPGSNQAVILGTLENLAQACTGQGKLAEAEKWQTVAISNVFNDNNGDFAGVPGLLRQTAQSALSRGNGGQGEAVFNAAIAEAGKKSGETSAVLGEIFEQFAYFLWQDEGRIGEGIAQLNKALAIQRDAPNDALAETLRNLGSTMLIAHQDAKEAQGYLQESLDLYRSLHSADDGWGTALPTALLGLALSEQGIFPEAEERCHEGMAIAARTPGAEPAYDIAIRALIHVLTAENKVSEAMGVVEDEIKRQRSLGDKKGDVTRPEGLLIDLLASPKAPVDISQAKPDALDFLSHLSPENLGESETATLVHLHDAGFQTEMRDFCRGTAIKYSTNGRVLNEIAWSLDLCLFPTPEDVSLAVTTAEKAVSLTSRGDPNFLDTLAVALSLAGQFTNAIAAEDEALALLPNTDPRKKADFADRIKVYQAGMACCDTEYLAQYVQDMLDAKKFAEAEPLARRNLVQRQIVAPDDWGTFSAQTLLGAALCGERKFSEAEALLAEGYRGLKQRQDRNHYGQEKQMRVALERLVEVCAATNQREQAEQWRSVLEDRASR